MSGIWPYVAALIPSVGIGILFWLVIKNMIEGDRKERLAHSQWEAEHDAAARDTTAGDTTAGDTTVRSATANDTTVDDPVEQPRDDDRT